MMSPELCRRWRTQSTCFCRTSAKLVLESSFSGDISKVCNLYNVINVFKMILEIKLIQTIVNFNLETWFSFKGVGCGYWMADLTSVVIASIPHSLMRLSGWLQTSSKWFVTGRQRTSTRFKFTSPVSKSFATANREGSLSKQTISLIKYVQAKLAIDKDNLLC